MIARCFRLLHYAAAPTVVSPPTRFFGVLALPVYQHRYFRVSHQVGVADFNRERLVLGMPDAKKGPSRVGRRDVPKPPVPFAIVRVGGQAMCAAATWLAADGMWAPGEADVPAKSHSLSPRPRHGEHGCPPT